MGICDGRARVDIAIVNGKLYEYEIKSDVDTLNSLADQKECYDKTFDRIIIIVGEKYENIIEGFISPWWGAYTVQELKNGKLILIMKREVNNPERITLLSDDREPLFRFIENHHSDDGNYLNISFIIVYMYR